MSPNILIAEDHDDNRAVLKRRLERRGYVVFEAENGAIAVEKFLTHAPDVVLMDISMPVMDGKVALAHIRASEGGGSVPIVALTAHAMQEMRDQCMALGFNAFVPKPIEFPELLDVIARLHASEGEAGA